METRAVATGAISTSGAAYSERTLADYAFAGYDRAYLLNRRTRQLITGLAAAGGHTRGGGDGAVDGHVQLNLSGIAGSSR